ncbi:hypothetical protein PCH_Pc17g01280, partial [Penicillium rubens Wisconsin 54-1255]
MALYSSNGLPYPRGHSRAMSMVHCHALACRSVSYSVTYMFRWSKLGRKRRQRVVVLALVRCGRMSSVLLESHRLQDQWNSRQVRIRFTYLRRGYSRFCLGNTHRGCTVDQLSRLGRRDIRHLRIDVWTSQPKSCLFDRLAGCKVDLV